MSAGTENPNHTSPEKIKDRLDRLNKRQKWLCTQIGVSSQVITNWKVRNQIPSAYLFEVAKLLECSPEWLAGVPENESKVYLSEKEKMLLENFQRMPVELQDAILLLTKNFKSVS